MSRNHLINLGKPIVLLNGLVTDKNNYTDEQKIQLLQSKKNSKFKMPKNIKIIKHIPEKDKNKNMMELSEGEDDGNEVKIFSALNSFSSKKKESQEENEEGTYEEGMNSTNNSKTKEELNKTSKSVNKAFSLINLAGGKKEHKRERNKTKNRSDIKKSQRRKKEENINKISDFSEFTETSNSNQVNLNLHINKKSMRKTSVRKTSIRKFFAQKEEETSEINIEYKKVPKLTSYEEILKIRKNSYNCCVYIPLLDSNDIKSIVENKSRISSLNKKLKKERKQTILISDKSKEINLTKALFYCLKNKNNNNQLELFKQLSPEYNNILQFMPVHYTGVNNYGFMNINYCANNANVNTNNINAIKNQEEIHFITNFFNDKNSQYVLYFRKYILNLSCFKQSDNLSNDGDYNIYHIIIPKNSVNKINININEEMSLLSLLKKLNCEYYFYCQRPGELLIVEPESVLLSYYSKEAIDNYQNFEKNYLIMYWNKMNKDSFSDYLILQNICKNEKYKNFPIVNTLINLINKQSATLSKDIIKIILEIYNDFDTYENINQYINDINENNIRFHKLYLNGIYLCQYCQQEIFNFYVYDQRNKNNNITNNDHFDKNNMIEYENNINNNSDIYLGQAGGQFICINCAHNKNFFKEEKNNIFFKYTKDEVNDLIKAITSKINSFRYRERKEIISEIFNGKKKDDCLNVDEFLLKIDGPLRNLDKDYEKNNINNKEIVVDKYLDIFNNKKNNDVNLNNIDPLKSANFINNITEKDLYEKLGMDFTYPLDFSFELIEPKMMSDKQENKINTDINFIPFNSSGIFSSNSRNNIIDIKADNSYENKTKEKEKEKKINSSNKGSRKNKKKNKTNMADIIFSGEF